MRRKKVHVYGFTDRLMQQIMLSVGILVAFAILIALVAAR